MYLIVKGNPDEATRAAIARGIPVLWCEDAGHGSTRLDVPEFYWRKAAEWLNEPDMPVRGHGYPAGSLLYFRGAHDDEADYL